MKTIEKEFTRRMMPANYEVHYLQVARIGNVAMYRRTAPEWVDFEVIRVRQSKAGQMTVKKDGEEKVVKFEAGEHYPSTASWGDEGFTFQTEARANAKMAELLQPKAAT